MELQLPHRSSQFWPQRLLTYCCFIAVLSTISSHFFSPISINKQTRFFTTEVSKAHSPFNIPIKSEPVLPCSNFPEESKGEEEGSDEVSLILANLPSGTNPAIDFFECGRLHGFQNLQNRQTISLVILHHSWKVFCV